MQNIERIINNIKVLYVEDEEITRIITKKILKKRVGKLIVAKNGLEGLDLFKKYKPDIVVTDLRMPILDGIGMIKNIRDYDQECGIIINTEVEDIDYILTSVDIGIDKYLVKPVDEEKMVESLEKVVLKVIKRKSHKNNLDDILQLSKEERKDIEDEIKKKIAIFIKNATGKGPRDIQVFLGGTIIEVKAYEVLTPMEKIFLENGENRTLVETYRKLFYKQKYIELVNLVSDITKAKCEIDNISIDVSENMEKLLFKLHFNE